MKPNTQAVTKFLKARNVEPDTVDWRGQWDSELTAKENFALMEKEFNLTRIPAAVDIKEMEFKAKKEVCDFEEERVGELLTKTLNKSNALGDFFAPLKNYVSAVIKSDGCLNSLFVVGQGGWGKTQNTCITLNELEKEYAYVNSHSTVVELVNCLWENRNGVIVFDDVEQLLTNPVAVSVLKSALWGVGNVRLVTYRTTSSKLTAPKQFEFSGKLIFLLNRLPRDNPVLSALLSRGICYTLEFSYAERMAILKAVSEQPYGKIDAEARKEVFDLISNNSDETTELSIRTLVKGMDLRQNCPGVWKELLMPMLGRDEKMFLMKRFLAECASVKEAQQEWCRETCFSSRTFYNTKKDFERRRG